MSSQRMEHRLSPLSLHLPHPTIHGTSIDYPRAWCRKSIMSPCGRDWLQMKQIIYTSLLVRLCLCNAFHWYPGARWFSLLQISCINLRLIQLSVVSMSYKQQAFWDTLKRWRDVDKGWQGIMSIEDTWEIEKKSSSFKNPSAYILVRFISWILTHHHSSMA